MYLKNIIPIIFFFQLAIVAQQKTIITGKLVAYDTQKAVTNATVSLKNLSGVTLSNKEGFFELSGMFPLGEQLLLIGNNKREIHSFLITITQQHLINLGEIYVDLGAYRSEENFETISLTTEQIINADEPNFQNQLLLQAKRDPFLNSVAFNWSSSFFSLRGLGSAYSKVLLNGVEMNTLYNQRPNWSNWTGLNDMLRNNEYSTYSKPNSQHFGGLIGTNLLQFDAAKYSKGTKLSIASTNRTYQGRVMLTRHTGLLNNGWAFSFSSSFSKAKEGYFEGASYKNYSAILSASKQISDNHRFNFTALYTPIEKGKVAPNTQEVIESKERQYNSYWGNQDGQLRNSRIKKVKQPIFTLNHFWNINKKLSSQNNLLLKVGKISNSRIEFNGRQINANPQLTNPIFTGISRNPDPTYFQRLPSFFIRENGAEDFESAFKAAQEFRVNGQLDWEELFIRNQNTTTASYVVYDDVVEDELVAINSIWNYKYHSNVNFQTKIAFKTLNSQNYAEITDLLGSHGFLDIDGFSEGNRAQNNLLTPNRIVGEGERFRYNYQIRASNLQGFLQTNFTIPKWEAYMAVAFQNSAYVRNGFYENGNYPQEASLGKSAPLNFTGLALKAGVTRQLTPKLYVSSSLNTGTSPPTIQQSFSNPRQNNEVVIGLKNQQEFQIDGTLNYQYGKVLMRCSGYYILRKNITNISFFFTENIAALGTTDNSAFIQEITTGINTLNSGVEFGAEWEALSTLKINMSMAYGKHIYANNPNLYITSDSFEEALFLGETKLKNLRLANGPQQAFGLGLSYNDPTYWWFNTQLNYFSNAYINVSPFTRTQNFATDDDGQPLLDFDAQRARELLTQEQFDGYFIWNAIGGKSWKLKNNNYLGITLGVQNILNQFFKTGGFEQSRNSNFRTLNEDKSRAKPLFGNRYWLGNGTTFYINTYWRF